MKGGYWVGNWWLADAFFFVFFLYLLVCFFYSFVKKPLFHSETFKGGSLFFKFLLLPKREFVYTSILVSY